MEATDLKEKKRVYNIRINPRFLRNKRTNNTEKLSNRSIQGFSQYSG